MVVVEAKPIKLQTVKCRFSSCSWPLPPHMSAKQPHLKNTFLPNQLTSAPDAIGRHHVHPPTPSWPQPEPWTRPFPWITRPWRIVTSRWRDFLSYDTSRGRRRSVGCATTMREGKMSVRAFRAAEQKTAAGVEEERNEVGQLRRGLTRERAVIVMTCERDLGLPVRGLLAKQNGGLSEASSRLVGLRLARAAEKKSMPNCYRSPPPPRLLVSSSGPCGGDQRKAELLISWTLCICGEGVGRGAYQGPAVLCSPCPGKRRLTIAGFAGPLHMDNTLRQLPL